MEYSKERISNALKAVKSKNTTPEVQFRKVLNANNIRGYRLHWAKVAGKPDIAFPSRQIAIFINGCFWHRCPYCHQKDPQTNIEFWQDKFRKNIQRDQRNQNELLKEGWIVLVLWECQIRNNVNECVEKVKNAIVLRNK